MTTSQVAALNNAQVIALTTAQVSTLNTTTLGALTTAQVGALEVADVASLTTANMAALTTTQVGSLTATQIAGLTTTQVAALTTTLVGALTTTQVGSLSTTGVGVLTTTNLAALTTTQVGGLTAKQIAVLSTAQLAAMTTSQVRALSNAQVIALTTTQASALTTTMVGALSTSQIAALETSDLRQLSTTNIAALTTTQISALTALQVCALTTTQLGALSTTQIGSMSLSSPIILDLNGDGISTLSVQNGTRFDLSADGSSVQTGWVAPTDGLLVLDRNHDGVINDGSELFGTSTTLQSGSKAIDGYQALSELDSNKDGVINSQDTSFSKLGVWVDSNSDAQTSNGELRSLSDLSITQLNLATNTARDSSQGNLIGLTSTYQTVDGSLHAAADVWFVVDNNTRASDPTTQPNPSNELVKAIGEFNSLNFATSSYDLNGKDFTSPHIAGIASEVNKLSSALNEYRSTTVNVAFEAINSLEARLENSNLSSPISVQSNENSTAELKKLFFMGPFKP